MINKIPAAGYNTNFCGSNSERRVEMNVDTNKITRPVRRKGLAKNPFVLTLGLFLAAITTLGTVKVVQYENAKRDLMNNGFDKETIELFKQFMPGDSDMEKTINLGHMMKKANINIADTTTAMNCDTVI